MPKIGRMVVRLLHTEGWRPPGCEGTIVIKWRRGYHDFECTRTGAKYSLYTVRGRTIYAGSVRLARDDADYAVLWDGEQAPLVISMRDLRRCCLSGVDCPIYWGRRLRCRFVSTSGTIRTVCVELLYEQHAALVEKARSLGMDPDEYVKRLVLRALGMADRF